MIILQTDFGLFAPYTRSIKKIVLSINPETKNKKLQENL